MANSKKARNRAAARRAYSVRSTDDGDGVEEPLDEQDDAVEEAATEEPARPARRRFFTPKRIVLGVLLLALVLVGGVLLWFYITVQRTLPTLSGTVQFSGLSAPVTVTRDVYGVPHIMAANARDLYAAQGYVHAQDRLFQMFQFRTVGQGRLSELLSPGFVEADRFLRTIGFQRAAEGELAELSPEGLADLEAYSLGINEFVRTHRDTLPLEFVLSGASFEDWKPVDSLAFGKLQAWDLTQTWDDDLLMSDLIDALGEERARQLIPRYPEDGPTIVTATTGGGLYSLVREYNAKVKPLLPAMGLPDVGSNNWVLSGERTTTGRPLLANDPHLGVRNPSPWYQIHLSTSDGAIDVVGFSFPGAPWVITGHNQDVAWGVTNTGTDVQDVFIEKLDPAGHPGQYQTSSGWEPLQLLTQTIKVKDGEPVTHTVRLTEHGPIINDAFTLALSPETTRTMPYGSAITDVVALRWTASDPGRLMMAVRELQTASNWEEFRTALEKWDVPGQNFVYADREGNIGYQMTGRVPMRKSGDGHRAVPGWTGEYDWSGYIPFDEMPNSYNPPEGYIATANHKPFPEGYKYDVPGFWSYPWRIERIRQMLDAKEKHSFEDMEAMQRDTRSVLAPKWVPVLTGLKPTDPAEQAALKLLEGWDGDIKVDSAAPAVYHMIMRRAFTETFADDLGQELFAEYIVSGNEPIRALELLIETPDDPFWDRTETPDKETRDDTLRRALTSAMGDLRGTMGDDTAQWQWGKVHQLQATHPFGGQQLIGGMFNLEAKPMPGDPTTVAVAGFTLFSPFTIDLHQSYRMIIDVGEWADSRAIFATGQSGQPYAKYWGNMLGPWQSFEYNPVVYEPEQLERNKSDTLVLRP